MLNQNEKDEIRKKLAQACRILYMEGLADYNLGHASCRLPGQELAYIKPQGPGLEEIKPDDLILIDFDCKKIEGEHPPHGENPIHTEIYKNRDDVGSVVHVHPLFTSAFSSALVELKPLNQEGVIFPRGVPIYESPELITTEEMGRGLTKVLDQNNAVVLRNHIVVTLRPRIEEACLNALFFEGALKIQRIASEFGEIKAISVDTALRMYEFCRKPKRYDMIWDYLVRKLERNNLSL
jgi:L-fuculose-phosphate aldolase